MPERTLTVRIIGDDRSLQQAFKRSEKAGKGFQVGVSGIGAAAARSILPAAAAAVSVQKAFQLVGASVDEASAVNEEVTKSQQIFGASSAEVVKWSDTMAGAFGVSKRAALEATGIFGQLFSVVGIGPAESAKLSQSLVELAADMASFNNASPEDVLLAIRSGLVGEAEPLRRYGVLLSEARVQQVAMAATGKDNVKSLTNQEKAQARYAIILKDSAKAQGDVARTGGGLAGQQRELAAQVANLEAAFGAVLIPTLTDFITTINDAIEGGRKLFDVLDRLGLLDPIKIAIQLELQFLTPGGPVKAAKSAADKIGDATADFFESAFSRGTQPFENLFANLQSGSGAGWTFFPKSDEDNSPGKAADILAAAALADAKRAAKAALEADRAKRRSLKAFDELEKGLGLKLKKAGLTTSTADDLAALREWERAIQKRIRAEGKTFALVEKLTDVRLQISAILASEATAAQTKISDAFDDALDALSLDLDIARTTRGFADDLRALRAIEQQILKQIAAEGRTTELLRKLFENRQAQAETLNNQRNAAQFQALGLTAEGDQRVAGRGSLLKRARSLQDQLKGTVLDTPKTRRQLDQIVAVLTNKTKSVGRDVRSAILDMLNDISSAFEDDGSSSGGPLTKFAKRGVGKLIDGLGLSSAQTHEIRQRFAQFGRLDLAGGGARPPGRTTSPVPGDRGGPSEPSPVNVFVYIDGQKVEATVTRRQQKKRGRNAPQRRGVNPGSRR